MAELRVPVVASLGIEAFSGTSLSGLSSFLENCVVDKYAPGSEERPYITQRPGINLYEDASDTVADTNGRGIYYWPSTNKVYFVNNDTIYSGSYSTTVGTISGGTERVDFVEIGVYLAIIDSENNEGWYIDTSDTLTQIADADFPSTLAHGAVSLDSYLFVLDEDGTIWNSALDDPTSWDALDFISAEREPDGGIALVKHHDHIIAMGSRTIEFFYDAGNPTGSPLSRRQDIYYNIGCVSGNTIWQQGDQIYFVGKSPQGHYGVYEISNFRVSKISTSELDSYLTTISTEEAVYFAGSGFSARGHDFYLLTPYTRDGSATPVSNLVFDAFARLWYLWKSDMTEISGLSSIPVVSWTVGSATSRFGQGILVNGDLITVEDTLGYVDQVTTDVFYMENPDDYVEANYVEENAATETVITIKSRFAHKDEGTTKNKFIRELNYVGDYTSSAQTLTIRYSDGSSHSSFQADRTIDTSSKNKLTRLGYTSRRTWELEYSGTETLRIEALEMQVDPSYV